MHEHFCYIYFPRSKGSPHSLVQNLLKEGMGRLYERYYINNDYEVLVNCETFRCYTGDCHHNMDSPGVICLILPVPGGYSKRCEINMCLPEWYYLTGLTILCLEGILKRVSDLLTLRFPNMSASFTYVTKSEYPDYAYILFDQADICDIIGPSEQWPKKILELFWSQNVGHQWDRFMLCTFVVVKCKIFVSIQKFFLVAPDWVHEWIDVIGMATDKHSVREFKSLLDESFLPNEPKTQRNGTELMVTTFLTTDTSSLMAKLNAILTILSKGHSGKA